MNTKLLVCGTVYKDCVPVTKTGEGGGGKFRLDCFLRGREQPVSLESAVFNSFKQFRELTRRFKYERLDVEENGSGVVKVIE